MTKRTRNILLGLAAMAVVAVGWNQYNEAPPQCQEQVAAQPVEQIDVVRGVRPVSTALAMVRDDVDAMANMSVTERGRYLEKHWPHLDGSLAFYLRKVGKVKQDDTIERIEFRYGSRQGVVAESGDGSRQQGFFENQLLAVVRLVGQTDPIVVLVECLNGTFMLPNEIETLEAVGDHTPLEDFTIGQGEGLIHHVDFPVAIDLAERHGLPLFKGKAMEQANRITPAEARELEDETDRVQVTVAIVEGDRFDLRNDTFTPSPRRHNRI